ncbi:cation-translocating P-type ATPase [Noviherbaspirillum pedocola]|uniref:Cation-translocating P-type ATPase n=1 Tax=Noviherbaspirillum pedocola TaxID=2801341 RepID=A0A934SZ41_9BURK|nr:cation-translocating P-type ATPase [Noviherbaspirillum pedocola]MBK4737676.1 cation-translocating P-type ATPase [Noviherbaspirillum pedocola]
MHTDPHHGLSSEEARRRFSVDGANEVPSDGPKSLRRMALDVVLEPMFLLLLACGAIYLLLGDKAEALMLLAFVFMVMGISLVQQGRTERSLAALRSISSPRALVIRDGQTCRIAGRDLVVDDIVLLAEGDRVPADMTILEASNLTIDESMLTGESVPVVKHGSLELADAHESGDVASMAYSGTLVIQGAGRGRVTATGTRSALGRIGASMQGLADERTPVQEQTRQVVKGVAVAGLALAAALAVAWGLLRDDWLHGLLAGVTFAMAVVPEELPVILSIFLGLGAWRLAQARVLARSVPAVELLGATTILCVDKTGTLTANRMQLRKLWSEECEQDLAQLAQVPEALHPVLEYAVLASHRRAFDPMETAIGAAGQALLANTEHLHRDWTLVDDYPLSRHMLAMSRVWQSPDLEDRIIAAKGAPEAIMDLCHLDAARSGIIAAQVERMAREGLRVLGVAQAAFAARALPENQHDFAFRFIGLVAFEDPLRPKVPQAIAECHAAGIRVVMITGDHPHTAVSIARQAGLQVDGEALTGKDIDASEPDLLRRRLREANVFCRVQPEHKLRLVQAFRDMGEIVAMTGDGINDAPALKAAHIGVAMGARGTDVAREAADLVLLDDDFTSLVTAVRYGRQVFANLRKAIVFIVAVHVPIVGLSIAPVLMGWPMLLMPVHILFLQLIIDPSCSLVFEAEPLEAEAMHAKPRRPDARLYDSTVLIQGLCQGGGLLAILLALFLLTRQLDVSDEAARTLMFSALVIGNLGLIGANRNWRAAAFWSWHRGNPYFLWIALATLTMLLAVVAIPVARDLFAFALPTPALAIAALAASLLAWLWFGTAKILLQKP